jgi:hypothetical protein
VSVRDTQAAPAPPRLARIVRLMATGLLLLLPLLAVTPSPTRAAVEGLTLEASVLLEGHARQGSWMAIDVHVKNDGPPIVGELRITGGLAGKTNFGTAVDLPTTSDKTYRLYAQPPGFGRTVEVSLIEGGNAVHSVKVQFTSHEPSQLVIGVLAERPGDIVGSLDLLPNAQGLAPLVIPLDAGDLPRRVEGWATLDRLIWQDTDAAVLEPEQLAAMRSWIAGGGRLIVVGGTTGPDSLAAFPDDILPYRPTTTLDIAPGSLGALLGELPEGAADLPAYAGALIEGRTLASSAGQVVAGERDHGSGAVVIIGFDPTVDWIDETTLADGLWRQLLPARTTGGPIVGDDSQLVSAVSQLPELALPPVGGLAILLGAYILLIGPINYLVLKRLDRREWAWVTMPVLIVAFAVGAYGFGSLLRGSELIVNEVAIVRGSPGVAEGTAQVYVGVFSPSRGTYQVRVPGGALMSAPSSGDFFGGDGQAASLDVLQGETSTIRDLNVGFGSLRTVRAESAVEVPLIEADLRLDAGRLKGTITNASDQPFLSPAVVLGGTVATLDDLAPGQSAEVDIVVAPVQFGQQLSDRIVGPIFFPDGRTEQGEDAARKYARHSIIDQLTYDPNWGGFTGQLPAEGAVVLGWSDQSLLELEIEGQEPKRTGNVLYFLPTALTVSGETTFSSDLLRSTVIDSDAAFFSKDPFSMSFGRGTVEMAYRPIVFEGTFDVQALKLNLGFGGEQGFGGEGQALDPLDEIPEPCPDPPTDACGLDGFDGMPEVELFDLTSSTWKRFPHMSAGTNYAINDPDRYVDPATGTVLIRFINDREEGVGFSLAMTMTGDLE